jgi:hypothetical protein
VAASTGIAAGGADEPAGGEATPTTKTPRPSTTEDVGEEHTMRIETTINGQNLQAILDDSAAGRDLLSQLPQTIEMRDHGGVEKTGPLRSPLSLDGQPDGAGPDIGDVGYYAPGNNFVLYYGDQSYYNGIVVLGHLESDAAARIAQISGSVTASISHRTSHRPGWSCRQARSSPSC